MSLKSFFGTNLGSFGIEQSPQQSRKAAQIPPTIGLLNQAAVGVDPTPTLVGFLLSQPQDVFQPIQSHQNNLGVHDSQQVTQRFDTTQIHQVPAEREQHQNH